MEKQSVGAGLEQEKRKIEALNRQVNYFIMRYMWQVIHGRSRVEGDTIYNAFNTSRERYTRIINTGVVRYGKNELEDLQQITGLRREIFTGEARFYCAYTLKKNGKQGESKSEEDKQVREITEQEWREWAAERKSGGERTKQKKICERLQRVDRTDMENRDFYRLCFYLKNMEPAPSRTSPETLRDITTAIKRLSFSLLDGCQAGQLRAIQKLLKEKSNLVSGMIVYKEARERELRK